MKGYKGTDKDMKCRGMQYKLGETAVYDGEPRLCKAQIEYVKDQIGFEDAIKRANAEKENHATGYLGAASATGDQGAASATGKAGVALAAGYECKAMGALGCAICCVERGEWDGETFPIIAVKAAIVDGEKIKADTWYRLKNGEFVEVE